MVVLNGAWDQTGTYFSCMCVRNAVIFIVNFILMIVMSPLCCEQALATFGDELGIAWSGAEDVALIEYAHLTGRPYRVFRYRVEHSMLNSSTFAEYFMFELL